jgi:hypothetical protein
MNIMGLQVKPAMTDWALGWSDEYARVAKKDKRREFIWKKIEYKSRFFYGLTQKPSFCSIDRQ